MDWGSSVTLLSTAAVVSAIISIAVRYALPERRWLFYIFKPLTTCLIIAVAVLPEARAPSIYGAAIALGLLFSLGGDIFLMLPGDRLVPGLASFMLALTCYASAFSTRVRPAGPPWISIPLVLFGALMLRYLWPGVPSRLRGPVSAYILVFVATASLAAYVASTRPSAGTACAAIGVVLFMLSDTVLAIDRFRRPFRLAQAVVLSSYFAGQLLIALSVGL